MDRTDAVAGLRAVERSEFVRFLRMLDKSRTDCQITSAGVMVVTRYLQDGVTVARQTCKKTPLGRILQAEYAVCADPARVPATVACGDTPEWAA